MARQRIIKPDFWVDSKTGTLTLLAQTTFIGTWNLSDDKGICRNNPAFIKSQLFPYNTAITPEDIEDVIIELLEKKLIILGTYHEENYFLIKNFSKHQRIDKPGKPFIPEELINEVFSNNFQEHSENIPGSFPEDSALKIKENKRREDKKTSSLTENNNKNDDDEILKILNSWKFSNPEKAIEKYGLEKVKKLIELVKTKNPKSPGAYFRALLDIPMEELKQTAENSSKKAWECEKVLHIPTNKVIRLYSAARCRSPSFNWIPGGYMKFADGTTIHYKEIEPFEEKTA